MVDHQRTSIEAAREARGMAKATWRVLRTSTWATVAVAFAVLVAAIVLRTWWAAGCAVLAAGVLAAPRTPIRVGLAAQAAAAGWALLLPATGGLAFSLATMAPAMLLAPRSTAVAGAIGLLAQVAIAWRSAAGATHVLVDVLAGLAWVTLATQASGWVTHRVRRSLRRSAPEVRDREVARQLARAAMTERRLLEVAANLRTTQDQLEADIRQRQEMADQLSVALVRADEAARAKSAFLASMSHELRTPLNSIIGFSSLMLKNGAVGASDRKYLDRIKNSGTHLLAIINDILDLSRIEAGKVTVDTEEVDLAALVHEVVDLLVVQAAPGVELRAELPEGKLITVSDAGRLRQVLVNLISNALKFTAQGSVTVRVVSSEHGVPARLEVVDTGIGIAPDRLEAIFDPFEQADNTTSRSYGGTGLGLAICRQLSDLLNTPLTVASTPGVGSTFALHFPVAGYATLHPAGGGRSRPTPATPQSPITTRTEVVA